MIHILYYILRKHAKWNWNKKKKNTHTLTYDVWGISSFSVKFLKNSVTWTAMSQGPGAGPYPGPSTNDPTEKKFKQLVKKKKSIKYVFLGFSFIV